MNIKTTVRFHLTQVRKAKIWGFLFVFLRQERKAINASMNVGKETVIHRWLKGIPVQPQWKSRWIFSKMLEMIPSIVPEDTCSSMSISALCTIARTWKRPRCPLSQERIMKAWFLDTEKFNSAIKKKEKFGKMELDITILSEVTQTQNQRNQCCMLSLTHGCWLCLCRYVCLHWEHP